MAVVTLTPAARAALQRKGRPGETGWVADVAKREGWQAANRQYLEAMRAQGRQEMASLMDDLGIDKPVSNREALDLIGTALALYLPEAQAERTTDEKQRPALRITVANCPTYARMEASRWHGVTACGSWHRRQGWYDALGATLTDTVIGEKKWGDEACAALVTA